MKTGPKPKPIADRFWPKVDKSGDCWEWTGCKDANGYGRLSVGGKLGTPVLVHRISYTLEYGLIPDGLCVCHHCDNPSCVNHDHLFISDHAGNMADMVEKNRVSMGEQHSISKLTEEDVKWIRQLDCENIHIAACFSISPSNVAHIKHRRTWRHV